MEVSVDCSYEKGGVKMILIQGGPQQTAHEKPLRISGDPQKVEMLHAEFNLKSQRGYTNGGGPSSQEEAKYRESRILHKGDKPPLLQGEKIPSNSREMMPGERIIPLPELKNMLRQQLEYYFSRENLSTDAYLISQMDADNYVPIVTISKFNQIRCLTEDLSLVVEVLRESAAVQVDEAGEKVRPNPWSGVLILREIPESTPLKAAVQVLEADEKVPISPSSVLILREIPEKTPLKEIEELFSSENCPKFSRCQFAHNNWYVLFDSDEDTQKAYRYLREEAKTFNGKPVMAQIKAKGITSAPFASYKNGVGNVSEADSYNAQNVNSQQQQQNPLQYTYTNAPNEGYNSQQVCPTFYPARMLQTWAPKTPACVDLGTVLSVNGLSPQAAFRPLTSNSNRHNYSSRERQRGHRKRGKENCTSGIHKALSSLYEDKAHISKAKVANISDIAIKEIESFKFTVQSVEQFIQTCPSEYKVAGLYVIDSIVRTSKKLLGSAKDVFGPRFVKNITTTFQHLFKCSEKHRAKIIRVLNVWQKKKLFPNDVIETLLDMGHPNTSKEFKEPRHKSSASWKGWPQNTEESVQEKTYAEMSTKNLEKFNKVEMLNMVIKEDSHLSTQPKALGPSTCRDEPPSFECPAADCNDEFGKDREPFPDDRQPPNRPSGERFDDGSQQLPPEDFPDQPFDEQYPPEQDQFPPDCIRFPPEQGRFPPGRDRFPPDQERFPPGRERFPPPRHMMEEGGFDRDFEQFPPEDEMYGPPPFRDDFPPFDERGGRGRRGRFPGRGRFRGEFDRFGPPFPHRMRGEFPPDFPPPPDDRFDSLRQSASNARLQLKKSIQPTLEAPIFKDLIKVEVQDETSLRLKEIFGEFTSARLYELISDHLKENGITRQVTSGATQPAPAVTPPAAPEYPNPGPQPAQVPYSQPAPYPGYNDAAAYGAQQQFSAAVPQ